MIFAFAKAARNADGHCPPEMGLPLGVKQALSLVAARQRPPSRKRSSVLRILRATNYRDRQVVRDLKGGGMNAPKLVIGGVP